MKIVNLVPHPVNCVDINGNDVVIPESGHVARATYTFEKHGVVDNILVERRIYTDISLGIDSTEPYTIYVVSRDVLDAMNQLNYRNIHQFVAPNTLRAKGMKIEKYYQLEG